jgi:uncharacterized protein (TIGR03086 family)
MTIIYIKELHRKALADASDQVRVVLPSDLGRATPCSEWNLRQLLEHVIGQNFGMATALRDGDAPADAFAPRSLEATTLFEEWAKSSAAVSAAVAETDATRPVRLIEIDASFRFPARMVTGMHLLDTVAHTWDIAASLGRSYRPAEELLAAFAQGAAQLPVDTIQEVPNPAFAPPVQVSDSDLLVVALARVGRRSTTSGEWDKEGISHDVAVRDR